MQTWANATTKHVNSPQLRNPKPSALIWHFMRVRKTKKSFWIPRVVLRQEVANGYINFIQLSVNPLLPCSCCGLSVVVSVFWDGELAGSSFPVMSRLQFPRTSTTRTRADELTTRPFCNDMCLVLLHVKRKQTRSSIIKSVWVEMKGGLLPVQFSN